MFAGQVNLRGPATAGPGRRAVHLPPEYARRPFDARDAEASDQQMHGITAEEFKEVHFQDGDGHAIGISDTETNDIDYLDLDYRLGEKSATTQFLPLSRSTTVITQTGYGHRPQGCAYRARLQGRRPRRQ